MTKIASLLTFLVLVLTSCTSNSSKTDLATESVKFNAALDSIYDVYVKMSPVKQTYLGIKDRQDEWGISNDSMSQVYYDMTINDVKFISERFKPENLDKQSALTYRMWMNDNKQSIENYKWRDYNYEKIKSFNCSIYIFTISIIYECTIK